MARVQRGQCGRPWMACVQHAHQGMVAMARKLVACMWTIVRQGTVVP
jgi:hypothetical protein